MKVDQTKRAEQAWSILTDCAKNEKTITYKKLAELMGVHHRPSRFFLELIQIHCKEKGLQPLSILVVNQNGKPGKGFTEWQSNDLEKGFQKVFSYEWSKEKNPFRGKLTKAKEIGLTGIINIICSEWEDYKNGKNVNKNHKVHEAVIELFPRLLSDWAHKAASENYPNIQTETLRFRSSTGEGMITLSPWMAIFDERNTVSARFGIYPVFLFSKDMTELNLTICVGATQFKDAYGSGKKSLNKVSEATKIIRKQFQDNKYKPSRLLEENLNLGAERSNTLHYFYEQGVIYKFPAYNTRNFNETSLKEDFLSLLQFYQSMIEDPMLPSSEGLIAKDPPKQKVTTHYKKYTPGDPASKSKKSSGYGGNDGKVVGDIGEKFVMDCEYAKLVEAGREDLAKQIVPHFKLNEFPGWDITSYDENGNEIYIEVKATKSDRIHGFIMSYNEMEKAKLPKIAPKYKIYRVLKALSKSPDLVVIDSIHSLLEDNNLSAIPLSYIIQKQ